jgi:DNA-binding response OmpR family regulator
MLLVFAGLLVATVIFNWMISKKLWKPFQTSLQKIRNMELPQMSAIHFEKTDTKEFSELNARIHAIIRRRSFQGNKIISFNEIRLDPEAQKVMVSGKTVDLTDKEYRLLEYFMANKGRVLTKSAIASHVWGDEYDQIGQFDFIYTHIKNLRKKIIEAGADDYIKTVHGAGYRFTDN